METQVIVLNNTKCENKLSKGNNSVLKMMYKCGNGGSCVISTKYHLLFDPHTH